MYWTILQDRATEDEMERRNGSGSIASKHESRLKDDGEGVSQGNLNNGATTGCRIYTTKSKRLENPGAEWVTHAGELDVPIHTGEEDNKYVLEEGVELDFAGEGEGDLGAPSESAEEGWTGCVFDVLDGSEVLGRNLVMVIGRIIVRCEEASPELCTCTFPTMGRAQYSLASIRRAVPEVNTANRDGYCALASYPWLLLPEYRRHTRPCLEKVRRSKFVDFRMKDIWRADWRAESIAFPLDIDVRPPVTVTSLWPSPRFTRFTKPAVTAGVTVDNSGEAIRGPPPTHRIPSHSHYRVAVVIS
ncbi:hypothetical protein DFP72DRAFT_857337 [Ephemerocybe angulata]|uniref:Uncharacterized protein n=1 Tax=Ephemerocybe angulata TaxID=980116 RepID=A0A8H6HCP7_9AGAR|nr:hypothetical protein DFP72DRAFT_857337 [Tulosesus angulatus]